MASYDDDVSEEVQRVVSKEVEVKWLVLGTHLGVPTAKLSAIQLQGINNYGKAVLVFKEWCGQPGDPCYTVLLKALEDIDEGGIARMIRKKFLKAPSASEAKAPAGGSSNANVPIGGLSTSQVKEERVSESDLLTVSRSLSTDWRVVGELLKIPKTQLNAIGRDQQDEYLRASKVLEIWCNSVKCPTWYLLRAALLRIPRWDIINAVED